MDLSCLSEIPAKLTCVPTLIANLTYWALRFAGIIAVFLIIYSSIKFINSGGDPKSVDEAKKTATYAVVGLIVVFCSFLIIRIISQVTGVSCINYFGFNVCS